MLSLIWKNVASRRVRSGLTILGLAVAIGAVVSLVGIARGFRQSLLDLLRGHQVDLTVCRQNMTDRTNSSLEESLADQIRAIPGVRIVEPTLAERVSLENGNAFGVFTQGLRPESELLKSFKLADGRYFKAGETREALIGSGLANELGKKVGDSIEFFAGTPFSIVGVFNAEGVMDSHSIVVPLQEMQKLTDRSGQVSTFLVMVDPGFIQDDLNAICNKITHLGSGLAAQPSQAFVMSDPKLKMASGMAWVTSFLALLIGSIGMLNTMSVSVFERTREIGVLRAIGWRRSRIVGMVLSEATLLSLAGATLGTLGAFGFIMLLLQFPTAKGLISMKFEWDLLGSGYGIALGVGLLAAAYPAWQAALMPPTEALRHD